MNVSNKKRKGLVTISMLVGWRDGAGGTSQLGQVRGEGGEGVFRMSHFVEG